MAGRQGVTQGAQQSQPGGGGRDRLVVAEGASAPGAGAQPLELVVGPIPYLIGVPRPA